MKYDNGAITILKVWIYKYITSVVHDDRGILLVITLSCQCHSNVQVMKELLANFGMTCRKYPSSDVRTFVCKHMSDILFVGKNLHLR